jgi:hypothetical protein
MRIVGSPAMQNENLTAFDVGYRTQVRNWLSMDLAAYYNIYDDLMTDEPGTPFPENSPSPPHLIIPLVASNLMSGETHGLSTRLLRIVSDPILEVSESSAACGAKKTTPCWPSPIATMTWDPMPNCRRKSNERSPSTVNSV